ncbi:MAG: TonB-dependent receptor [Acidobacteriota bacterium]
MMVREGRVRRGWLVGAAAVIALLVVTPPIVQAQTETGRVAGTVTDASGGVLPGVTVTLMSTATRAMRTSVTDAAGRYTFSNVLPGEYELIVELVGFATRRSRVGLAVGGSVELTAKLDIAAQTETINVVAETPVVNTVNSEVSTVVGQALVRELPSITRNIYDFVAVSGNVSTDDPSGVNGRGAGGYVLNGLRAASTNVLLDGSANNDEFRASIGMQVPLDSVQEFSVVTANFSAQYGRAAGGVVNVVTKSGTNTLSGSAYSFFRNEKLASNLFDNEERGVEKDPFDRSQNGVSIGGPIRRDRIHFFGSAEYIRVRSNATDVALVPTPQFLAMTSPVTQAFFNDYRAFPINGSIVTAGEIAGVRPGGPFSQIPANTPVFGQVIQQFPSDAGAGLPVNEYQAVGRVDWSLGNNSSVYVRYAVQNQDFLAGTNANSAYEGFNTGTKNDNQNILGSYTRVWSNTFTTQTKFVYNRLKNDQPLNGAPTPTLYLRASRTSIGGIKVSLPGYLPYNPGSAIPFGGPQKLAQFYQDGTAISGSHELRFGGSFVRIMDDRTFGAFMNPVQTLGGSLGEALDNLMLGRLLQFQTAIDPQGRFPGETVPLPVEQPDFTRHNRYNEWALYVSDTWRPRNRLTLNLGLRYEYYGVQHNTDPSLDSNYYFGTGNQFERIRTGQMMVAPESPVGALWKTDKNNFAPRLGVAWDLFGDGRTSVRGGYGMGYERNFGNVTFNVIQNPPGYAVVSLLAPNDVPVLPIFRSVQGPLGGTGTARIPSISTRNVDPDIVNAYAHFWSAAFQHELWKRATLSLEYVGSAGESLYTLSNVNRSGTGAYYLGDANPNARLRTTQYTNMNTRSNGGRSRYHGIIAGVSFSRLADMGLDLSGRYTYGRAQDNLSSTFSESFNNLNLGLLDPFDPDLDWGWADYDVRHRVAISGVYELPFFKNAEGWTRTLGGGWQAAWIFTAQTGAPFTIFDCSNAVTTCARMAQVADINAYTRTATGSPNQYVYLDLANQATGIGSIVNTLTGSNEVPPEGGYPSTMTERNAFRRPGRWMLDASFVKRFRFGARTAASLRVEVYNILNRANWYVVDDAADISGATEILAVRGYTGASGYGRPGDGQRRVQIGFRFEF